MVTQEFMPKPCSFQQIKGRLDPRCVYMVFEKGASAAGHSEFGEVDDLLRSCQAQILAQDLYYDAAAGKAFMVVKLDQGSAPNLRGILLHPRLPRGLVVYLYGNLPPEQRTEPVSR
jgi:hypothetical protein